MVALFPEDHATRRVPRVGLVLSVWVSTRKPKLATSKCSMSHCVAARVVEMSQPDAEKNEFECDGHAAAWVLRPESIVAVLAFEIYVDSSVKCTVVLNEESGKIYKDLESLA